MPFTIEDVRLVGVSGASARESGLSYSREFQIDYSGAGTGANSGNYITQILRASDARFPRDGSVDVDDPIAYCVARTAQRISVNATNGQGGTVLLKASFAYPVLGTWSPLPWERKPRISGGGGAIVEVLRQDADGKPIVNSVGDYYDPLFEQPIACSTWTIVRYEQNNPSGRVRAYSYTSNTNTFYGMPAGSCLFGELTWTEQRELINGVPALYYEVTYPITQRDDGWAKKIIDNGYKIKVTGGSKVTKKDQHGTPTQTPVLLDGHGGELADGADPVYFPADGYRSYRLADWTSLALPDPTANGTP